MAKRLARGSDDKENDPDLDDFKSSKKSKTVKRFGSPTSESRMAEITKGFVPFNTKNVLQQLPLLKIKYDRFSETCPTIQLLQSL